MTPSTSVIDDHAADRPRDPAAGSPEAARGVTSTGDPTRANRSADTGDATSTNGSIGTDDSPDASGAGRRPRLDRDRIVTAALRLARDHGIEAVSMRRVADELGSGAMSLYRHVADRQELLVAMLDAVTCDIELPAVDGDPRAELTNVMTALHDLFHREHWMLHVLVVDRLASTELLPVSERVFAALDRAGLDRSGVLGAYALLSQHLYGEAMTARHRSDTTAAMRLTLDVLERAPHLYPTMARLFTEGPLPERRHDFATNLARLLDGILGPRTG